MGKHWAELPRLIRDGMQVRRGDLSRPADPFALHSNPAASHTRNDIDTILTLSIAADAISVIDLPFAREEIMAKRFERLPGARRRNLKARQRHCRLVRWYREDRNERIEKR